MAEYITIDQSLRGPKGDKGLPGVNAVANDDATAGYIKTPGSETEKALSAAFVGREPDGQNPDDPQRWYFGPPVTDSPQGALYMEYHGGWLAQRFSFGGVWGGDSYRTAPTVEIFPAASFYRPDLPANDNEMSISPLTCFQLYRYGHGDTADREYFYIEAHNNAKPKYEIGAWASGTGTIKPVTWRAGNIECFTVTAGGEFQIERRIISNPDTAVYPLVRAQYNQAQTLVELRAASDDSTAGRIFSSKTRGTVDAPTAPLANDYLLDFRAGSILGGSEVFGGAFRIKASENWTPGSAQGTNAIIRVTPGGTAAAVDALTLANPSSSLDTSATLLINIAGTVTAKRVTVGAADSAGTGFRALMVAN